MYQCGCLEPEPKKVYINGIFKNTMGENSGKFKKSTMTKNAPKETSKEALENNENKENDEFSRKGSKSLKKVRIQKKVWFSEKLIKKKNGNRSRNGKENQPENFGENESIRNNLQNNSVEEDSILISESSMKIIKPMLKSGRSEGKLKKGKNEEIVGLEEGKPELVVPLFTAKFSGEMTRNSPKNKFVLCAL